MKVSCGCCSKELEKKPSYVKRYAVIYCSKECRSATMKVESTKCVCGECSTEFYLKPYEVTKALKNSLSKKLFCSHSCSAKYNNKLKGADGVTIYRERAIKEFGAICNRCGYDSYVEVLQVHHKDRDRTNGALTNLEVLCPTCHNEDHFLNKDGSFWKTFNKGAIV